MTDQKPVTVDLTELTPARAGLDIGNATTEVVIVDTSGRVLAADRTPTRGRKGSDDSIRGAAALLARTARRAHVRLTRITTCEIRPVHTVTVSIPAKRLDTGPVSVLRAGAPTAGGTGFGVGRPGISPGSAPTDR